MTMAGTLLSHIDKMNDTDSTGNLEVGFNKNYYRTERN